jgi:hypothetical protein
MHFRQWKRRDFITLLGGAAAAWPLAARAQQTDRMQRIGVLMGYAESNVEGQAFVAAFHEELLKLGWAEGRNLRSDYRWAPPGDAEAARRFAKELVRLQPNLILAHNTAATAAALEQAHHPDPFCHRRRSGRQWLRRQPFTPRRQRHRFHHAGADDGRQMARAAQGDCATREPGGLPV